MEINHTKVSDFVKAVLPDIPGEKLLDDILHLCPNQRAELWNYYASNIWRLINLGVESDAVRACLRFIYSAARALGFQNSEDLIAYSNVVFKLAESYFAAINTQRRSSEGHGWFVCLGRFLTCLQSQGAYEKDLLSFFILVLSNKDERVRTQSDQLNHILEGALKIRGKLEESQNLEVPEVSAFVELTVVDGVEVSEKDILLAKFILGTLLKINRENPSGFERYGFYRNIFEQTDFFNQV
ncbi:MAG: hypothetical protein NZO16_01670 [Deltaproteobacteria bacterium]|nr:hypothetical protein [Deltaproteobacteria bacterium]